MLRLALFFIAAATGAYYALQAPFYALLFYLGNAYFRPEDWVSVGGDLVKSLRLSFVIGLYLLVSCVLAGHKFVCDGKVALLWLFLLLSICSTVLSEYSALSWPYLLEFTKVVLFGYLIVILTTDFGKFRLVVLVIVLALGLEQGKQGWFYLLTSPGVANNNPVAFLGDNNGTAVGILMLVPLIIFLIQTTNKRLMKVAFACLAVGCLYRALSTYSRGAFVAVLVMAGVWLLRSHQRLRNCLGVVAVLAVILPMLPATFWHRMGTIQTYKEDRDESALGRLHFWSVAVEMASTNPLIGVGFNSYNEAYNAYDETDGKYGRERSVHNSFFGVLAELGYFGFSCYALIIWSAFRACARVKRYAFRNPTGGDVALGASALQMSLVAFVVGGSFVALQYNEMLWHLIALTFVLGRLAVPQKNHSLSKRAAGQCSRLASPAAA